MSKLGVVWTCAHADGKVDNKRFDLLGKLIYDLKPDYCIDLGDGADMRSLNSYDKARPEAVVMQNYGADIKMYNDSQERLRHQFRYHRKKKPAWFGFEGNHEHRIKTALGHDPRLEDVDGQGYGISFKHLNTDHWFDEYHEYENSAPAIHEYDGVGYAHYVGAGNFGRAISGVHHAYGLLQKRYSSTTVGHSHKRGMYFKDEVGVNGAIGLVAGCFKGADEGWAGQANREWAKGVVIKREIENGMYDPQWVSLRTLEKEYG